MKERYLIRLFSVFILGGAIVPTYCLAGPIKAFSLREADRLLGDGHRTTGELEALGGITRFVGMVFDRENGDIILVGKVREDLPIITIDDLAVALRCRLLSGQYPCVSIDMTDATAETGMQEVRFVGDIGKTQFGSDFLQSDVILKRYSLDLLQSVEGVMPYLKQYETDVVTSLEIDGRPVQEVQWFSEEDSRKKAEEYKGRDTIPGRTVQSRFWFHVIDDDSYIVEQDDVYVIEELRLGVKAETMQSEVDGEIEGANATDIAAEEFSRQFTEHYDEVCGANPTLKRLKAMFDLVCIAEGVANLGNDRPRLDALLNKYSVRPRATPREYSLVHRVGEVKCENDDVVLCQLSGGISLEALLMALEDGDVSGLKLAVLGTRPSEDALCWTLPLDEWAMPNNEPEETGGPSAALPQKMEVHLPGFSLTAQSYIFPKDKTGLETSAFAGFDAPASTSPLQESRPQFQRHERLTISIENTKLQEALLAEDWGRVVGLLQNVDIKTADPILRFVKAHACLATNRNNESVLLFLSSNSDDLRTWHEWTSHFAQEHTQDAVGQYLLGDGLARLGQYDDAVQAFGRGLKAKTDHALLMNAQGVAYAKLDRLREARRCFDGAVAASNGKLADAYANLGAYWIQRGEGAEGAEAAFTKAIELSGGSAIASHGRLCVRLVLGKATSDEDPSGPQMAFPGLDVLMDENLLRYIEDYASADDVATAVASARTGGTFLSRQYSSRNQRLQSLQTGVTNDLATIDKIRTSNMPGFVKAVATNTVGNFMYRKLEAIQTQYGSAEAAKTVRAQTPQHQVAIADRYATVERWNQGGAQRISGAGRNIAAAGGTAAAAAGALDPEPFSKAGWIAVGGASAGVSSGFNSLQKAQQSRAQQSRTMLQELKPDFDRALANHSIPTVPSMPRGYQPVQIPAPAGVTRTRPAESTAGGADLSMKGINWDDGNWPFRPLFGLLYGLQMVTESSTPRPNVQATN